ncbi:uncharacterized protein C2845_PM05G20860 [Panicum miliaceum]|uniref:Uncharacterized protein n=1 Tax=Panicum miliaceum TaxID=4540 RepID=A0A3L6SU93_PANMI|nr:uncharacterized protein C2845_PM05G20860 [Panicum miliaceum]
MARRHGRHPSHVRIALLVLAGLAATVVVSTLHSAADPEDAEFRISVHYPTAEESQWLDRWAEKYRGKQPGSDFSVEPATGRGVGVPEPHLLRRQEWRRRPRRLRRPHRVQRQRPS